MHVIKDNLFPAPRCSAYTGAVGNALAGDVQVFNMGHRCEIYTNPAAAQRIIEIATSLGLGAQIIGSCEKAPTRKLTIRSEYGEFRY
jgi:phosphoribosylformylglycinamidine cyclo-ligase